MKKVKTKPAEAWTWPNSTPATKRKVTQPPADIVIWGKRLEFDAPPRLWRKGERSQWMVKVNGQWKRLVLVLAEAMLGRAKYRSEIVEFKDGNSLHCHPDNIMVRLPLTMPR